MLAGSVVQFDSLKISERRIILGEIGTSPGAGFSSRRVPLEVEVALLFAERISDFRGADGDFGGTDFGFRAMVKRLFHS